MPLLLVCGDQDPGFSKEVYEETARLIPDCTLRMYEGIGHMGVTSDRRFPQDVLDLVRQRPAVQPERGADPLVHDAMTIASPMGQARPTRR